MAMDKLKIQWKGKERTLEEIAKIEQIPVSRLKNRYYQSNKNIAVAVYGGKRNKYYEFKGNYYTVKNIADMLQTSTAVINYFLKKNNKNLIKALEELETPKGRAIEEKILKNEIKEKNKGHDDSKIYGDILRRQQACKNWYLLLGSGAKPTYKDKLDFIYHYYGNENQQNKLIEEMQELKKAIYYHDKDNYIEELADVLTVLTQLTRHLKKDDKKKLQEYLNYKANRQVNRILEANKK